MLKTTSLHCGYKIGSFNSLVLRTKPLRINESDLLFLVGRNGTGKSTLLHTLAGALPALEGEVLFHGSRLYEGAPIRQRPAFLPSHLNIHGDLFGKDLYLLFALPQSRWYRPQIFEALEVSHLLNRRIGSLSSGERQRLLIATTLSHPSDLVLIDEPTSHIDIHYLFPLTKILQTQCQEGRAIVITSHDFNWVLRHPNAKAGLIHDRLLAPPQSPIELFESETFQQSFTLKSQIIENPMDHSRLFACTHRER